MSSQFEKMKNWPWKRILIGTAVISSIAASSSFGTYAYFTSQVQETSAFTAGKLEIGLGTTETSFRAEGDEPFLPGVRFEKKLRIENMSDVPVKYALLANKQGGDDIVYDQLMVEVRRGGSDGDLLYMGRVSQLTRANVIIAELEKEAGDDLHFSVYLPESTGNEVQQKSAEVEFGFLATQIENGEYFAQSGPVMTLTPADFEEGIMKATERVMKDTVQGTTFILAEGSYSLPNDFTFPANSMWKAEKGKEGKVVLDAEDLNVKEVSFDGITFSGSGVGLYVDTNVSISNSFFEGYEVAIQTTPGDSEGRKGLTVKNSIFKNVDKGIVLDQEMKAVVIAGNTFENVEHAVAATGEKASEIQIVGNDFTKVSGYAVDSDGVRIGDGITGFKEATEENGSGEGKLAVHVQQADFYLEANKYK
ncbi:MAG TPA: right-handed parallel beta-helix repeat-containing protein [Candidatus Bathyarchaeia archaeon]|nr:right-handed parallel beta-helix repeat-containing protein [Candidatus Bathyarchaeia archaeon]